MKYFLLFIAPFAISSASAQVETKLHPSQSGKYAIVQRGPIYESQGWEWSFKDNLSGRETALWKSVRSVEIHWNENEQWMALQDPLMRLSSVVLVFRLDQESPKLVYQSPYSESNYDISFQFEKWSSKDSHFGFIQSINVEDRDQTAMKCFIPLSVDMRTIAATAYDASGGDYGAPKTDMPGAANETAVDSFRIAWHEGYLTGNSTSDLKFVDLGDHRESAASSVVPLVANHADIQWPREVRKLWLGAYCRNEKEFALFVDAVLAIRGVFGHDPPGVGYKFPGEAFYFLTSCELKSEEAVR